MQDYGGTFPISHRSLTPCFAKSGLKSLEVEISVQVAVQVFVENESEDMIPAIAPGSTYQKLNWLRAGILTADKLLTVSPNYAKEVAEDDEKGVELSGPLRSVCRLNENQVTIIPTCLFHIITSLINLANVVETCFPRSLRHYTQAAGRLPLDTVCVPFARNKGDWKSCSATEFFHFRQVLKCATLLQATNCYAHCKLSLCKICYGHSLLNSQNGGYYMPGQGSVH